jgi:hypothetical protein
MPDDVVVSRVLDTCTYPCHNQSFNYVGMSRRAEDNAFRKTCGGFGFIGHTPIIKQQALEGDFALAIVAPDHAQGVAIVVDRYTTFALSNEPRCAACRYRQRKGRGRQRAVLACTERTAKPETPQSATAEVLNERVPIEGNLCGF